LFIVNALPKRCWSPGGSGHYRLLVVLLEYHVALLEYLNLLIQVPESGSANAGPAGLWAMALQNKRFKTVA